jgi:hypothetical protein
MLSFVDFFISQIVLHPTTQNHITIIVMNTKKKFTVLAEYDNALSIVSNSLFCISLYISLLIHSNQVLSSFSSVNINLSVQVISSGIIIFTSDLLIISSSSVTSQ